MPFKVKFHIWEPGKDAPKMTTDNKALAYIEYGSLRQQKGMEFARMTHEITPFNLTGPEKFLYLAYRTRKAQEVFWSAKRQNLPKEVIKEHLVKARGLEKQLDLRIADARFYLQGHPKSQHEDMPYNFFLIVEAWREKQNEYFRYLNGRDIDALVAKQMRKEIDDYQGNIDNYVKKNIGF